MVHSDLITAEFVGRAELRGLDVHAWTINQPQDVGHVLDSGVRNIVTDNPSLIRKRLDEIRGSCRRFNGSCCGLNISFYVEKRGGSYRNSSRRR